MRQDTLGVVDVSPIRPQREWMCPERSSLVMPRLFHRFLQRSGRHVSCPKLQLSTLNDFARVRLYFQNYAARCGVHFELLPAGNAGSPAQIARENDPV